MKKIKNKKISFILFLMCFFLVFAITIQIKTVNNSTTVGKTQTENELRDSVLRWKEKYENAYKTLEAKENELDKLREDASNSSDSSTSQVEKLNKYNLILGKSDVKGTGLIITLTDGDSSTAKGLATDYIVHDGDLLEVVNALRNAGAEAISINDQRIVANTSINCIGNVVTINGEKVGAPFVIKAIGRTALLYGALTIPGGYIDILKNAGVQVKIDQVDKNTIEIPKFDGIYKLDYINNVE